MVTSIGIRAGDRVLLGSRLVTVTEEFASQMQPGDVIVGSETTGILRIIPHSIHALVDAAVSASLDAFQLLSQATSAQFQIFFNTAADLLSRDDLFDRIASANQLDVQSARERGRSVTRLIMSQSMRSDMVAAFHMWRDVQVEPFVKEETISHDGWKVEQWRAPLGVVGFVFEGRPNVFADATGVLRGGNTVVFRIGSDALGTAQAIMETVIAPALEQARLPKNAILLLESKEHAAGWALFSHSSLSLAVARGSGESVAELGAIARHAGIPASLHGTGGAWMIIGDGAHHDHISSSITYSLDRKVCNTLNLVCLLRERAQLDFPIVVEAAQSAAHTRGTQARFHCVDAAYDLVTDNPVIEVHRAEGTVREQQFTQSVYTDIGHEWEWEENPELFVLIVDSIEEGIQMFNRYSPQFVVSVISNNEAIHDLVWRQANSPFVGNGMTRWVDGQFSLLRPELGLSNWQFGRLFGRGGVLSGDSIFSVRLRMSQDNFSLHR